MKARTAVRVALPGVAYDDSSSYFKGSASAPPLIREALWSEAGNCWSEGGVDLRAASLDDDGDLIFAQGESGERARELIEAAVDLIGRSGRRPLVLGGDHSITYPVLRGLRPHCPRLSILHLDAHPDLSDVFEGDRDSHACPFARIMEQGLAERGGLTVREALSIIHSLEAPLVGADLVEFKPLNDPSGLTAAVCGKLVRELAATMLKENFQ